jgi:hypothetical protein
MSDEQTEVSEVVESSPSGAEASETQESSPSVSDDHQPEVSPESPIAAETPQYTPNYSFKVMDKNLEFDEFLRASITSEDHEKKLRELYEKSYGLDYVKPKYEKIKEEYQNLNNTWQKVVSDMNKLGGHLKQGDYGSVFSSLGLTDEQVMQYAVERLSYYELPPEKRQAMDEQSRRNRQLVEAMQENAKLKQDYASFEGQKLMESVQATVQKLGASTAIQAINERAGYDGAFYDLLKNHALGMFERTKRDPSPEEAISSFLKLYGLESGQSQSPSQVGQVQAAQQATGARPATIPVLKGAGVSPVKPTVRSIDDLKKIRDQKLAR